MHCSLHRELHPNQAIISVARASNRCHRNEQHGHLIFDRQNHITNGRKGSFQLHADGDHVQLLGRTALKTSNAEKANTCCCSDGLEVGLQVRTDNPFLVAGQKRIAGLMAAFLQQTRVANDTAKVRKLRGIFRDIFAPAGKVRPKRRKDKQYKKNNRRGVECHKQRTAWHFFADKIDHDPVLWTLAGRRTVRPLRTMKLMLNRSLCSVASGVIAAAKVACENSGDSSMMRTRRAASVENPDTMTLPSAMRVSVRKVLSGRIRDNSSQISRIPTSAFIANSRASGLIPSAPPRAPWRASARDVSMFVALFDWHHSNATSPKTANPNPAPARSLTARRAQGESSWLVARNAMTGTTSPFALVVARKSTSLAASPSSTSAFSARSLRMIQWHIAKISSAPPVAGIAACPMSESSKGVRRSTSWSRIFGMAPSAAFGTLRSRRKNRSLFRTGPTVTCSRVRPRSASQPPSVSPRRTSGSRVSTIPAGNARLQTARLQSRRISNIGNGSPLIQPNQRAGMVSRSPVSHHCEKSCHHVSRTWNLLLDTTDTSAIGTIVPLLAKTFDSAGSLFTNSLRRVTIAAPLAGWPAGMGHHR